MAWTPRCWMRSLSARALKWCVLACFTALAEAGRSCSALLTPHAPPSPCHHCHARRQLSEADGFDDERDAASVAYNAAIKGAVKVG
jgi:hypothetical protein